MRDDTLTCVNCNAVIEREDRFCAVCGSFAGRRCLSCDASLSAEAQFCSHCGTAVRSAIENPTPALPGQVGGERKHLTVLFADLVGSTSLLADIGEEQGRWLLEAVIDRMKTAVEAFDGVVTQVNGDGIMALFGAPRALEAHALRACHAALRMIRDIEQRAPPEALGKPVSIRVGLHSGDVVVAEQRRGLGYQYAAFGVVAHLAARMEQIAQPGQVRMSASTFAQVSEQVEARHIERTLVKGSTEPIDIYLLLKVRDRAATTPRHPISTAFVGRQPVLAALNALGQEAWNGQGRVVVVTGSAGSGKSRLCLEFLRGAGDGFHLVHTAGASFIPQPAYGGVADCLRPRIPPEVKTPAEIAAWLLTLLPEAPEHAHALLPLLTPDGMMDSAWITLSYKERRSRTLAAVVHLLHRMASDRPVLVFIDDLQWVDQATRELIAALPPRITDSRILVLANMRTDDMPPAVLDAAMTLIRLDPFTETETGHFLDTIFAPALVVAETKQHLYKLTGGNAFFLEEVVKTLRGGDAIPGDGAALIASHDLRPILPGTVQDLLTMRIDNLPALSKRALQAAAVLGMEMETAHLAGMLGVTQEVAAAEAEALQEAAFFRPTDTPDRVWSGTGREQRPNRLAFRHALARDAAYVGLLRENRELLHARALDVLETSDETEPSVLAFHARTCENWMKAHHYGEAAGRISIARAAPREALQFFDEALVALGQVPADGGVQRAELDLRFLIRNTLFSLGRARDIGPHLEAAHTLAEQLGDKKGQARALCQSAHYAWQIANWTDALAMAERARALSVEIDELGLQAFSIFYMGLAVHALGNFKYGAELLAHNVSLLPGSLALERFGAVSVCSVVSGSYLAICLTELGRFAEAEDAAVRAREAAEKTGGAFDRIQANLASAGPCLMRGEAEACIALLEATLVLCGEAAVVVLLPRATSALALAYALAGRFQEALALAAERKEQSGEAIRAMSCIASIEALILADHLEAAETRAENLVRFTQTTNQPGATAWGQLLRASCHLARREWRAARRMAGLARAHALGHEMTPLTVRSGLVEALAAGRGPGAAGNGRRLCLREAIRACEGSGMGAWVQRTLALSTRPPASRHPEQNPAAEPRHDPPR
jgi:class 3 adenylate cyclase/tetratricopeptide (TPR) repeat protein